LFWCGDFKNNFLKKNYFNLFQYEKHFKKQLQLYSRPTMLILYTPKRYIKLEDRDWRSQKKAVLLKNWSLHFFAQFCLGVLSKFVLDPFSFWIEPFSQRVYFILTLVIDLKKKERESRWKIIKKKCYRLDKNLAIKKKI